MKNKFQFITHKELEKELFKRPGFKKAYDMLDFEFDIIKKILDYRIKKNLNRQELASTLGISIYLLDKLMINPDNSRLSIFKKVANGLGLKLSVK